MDSYFNIIKGEKYELGVTVISDFYRCIGEIYLGINENLKALEWFKSGLKINSKLSVKRVIQKLKKQSE